MKDFMILVEGDGRACSPAEMEKKLSNYGSWMSKYMEKGQYISGAPFSPTGVRIDEKGLTNETGSFLDPASIIGGYVHLKAMNIQEATLIAMECPLLNPMKMQVRPFHEMK